MEYVPVHVHCRATVYSGEWNIDHVFHGIHLKLNYIAIHKFKWLDESYEAILTIARRLQLSQKCYLTSFKHFLVISLLYNFTNYDYQDYT